MNKHTLLLFDLDETLLGSDWFKNGLIQTLGIHSFTKKLDASLFLERKLNVPKSLILPFKKREITPLEFRRARWRHAFSHFDVTPEVELLDELDALFVKTGMSCIEQDPSITHLLFDLTEHYQLGIVTNALYDPRQKIYHMGLSEVFPDETVFDADGLGYRKPDREIYSAALTHFHKTPEETLFIGDSWIHDVAGPIDAGMEAIWINAHNHSPLSDHSPFAIVSDVREIRKLLLPPAILPR
ncbi:HAD family hydrolase [Fictibacillus nanhaiensis]|uniref:HAD family hydrolase n=1 Tax=Fictibacillus nanhaiensis TaxID=742169 RepID=UPI001C952E01|nr:HAD family hydrolase [Fictibacillus nanhaiensis]MBY6037642.1 HAD family hydrolase [Fictibacillus nanhaiensis]